MKLFTKLFILSAAVTALSGCRSDLLDTVPYDKAASNSMWTNENFCELGVTGVYHELREDYIAKKHTNWRHTASAAAAVTTTIPFWQERHPPVPVFFPTIGNSTMKESNVQTMQSHTLQKLRFPTLSRTS